METENSTPRETIALEEYLPNAFQLHRPGAEFPVNLSLSRAEVQAIVQQAYDQHGILASPSYALEAERATERKPGQCPCGTEGCSDRTGDGPDPIREGLQRVFA